MSIQFINIFNSIHQYVNQLTQSIHLVCQYLNNIAVNILIHLSMFNTFEKHSFFFKKHGENTEN